MRLPKDKEKEVQKALEICRREYIHGVLINEELVFPSLEQLVTRYRGKLSLNRLQQASRKEKWRDKRESYKLPSADIVIPDANEEVDDVIGYAKNVAKMLLSELQQVESARIKEKKRRTPKELGEIGKFIKTVVEIATGDQNKGDTSIMINVNNIVAEFKRNYGKSLVISEDAREILEDNEEEQDTLEGQIRMLEEEESTI